MYTIWNVKRNERKKCDNKQKEMTEMIESLIYYKFFLFMFWPANPQEEIIFENFWEREREKNVLRIWKKGRWLEAWGRQSRFADHTYTQREKHDEALKQIGQLTITQNFLLLFFLIFRAHKITKHNHSNNCVNFRFIFLDWLLWFGWLIV